MSTSISQPARAGSEAPFLPPRPRLTMVPRAAFPARRLPFVLFLVAVLATGLVGLLLLNTSMERSTYRITSLRSVASSLSVRQQILQLQVAALQDPQEVAEKALGLGMVQNPSPAFVSLATGQIIGRSVVGVAGDRFDIGTKIGPSVDRLGKISPIVGGEANGAGIGLVKHPAPRVDQGKTATNSRHTGSGSQTAQH